jgi:hypothetical protein
MLALRNLATIGSDSAMAAHRLLDADIPESDAAGPAKSNSYVCMHPFWFPTLFFRRHGSWLRSGFQCGDSLGRMQEAGDSAISGMAKGSRSPPCNPRESHTIPFLPQLPCRKPRPNRCKFPGHLVEWRPGRALHDERVML